MEIEEAQGGDPEEDVEAVVFPTGYGVVEEGEVRKFREGTQRIEVAELGERILR